MTLAEKIEVLRNDVGLLLETSLTQMEFRIFVERAVCDVEGRFLFRDVFVWGSSCVLAALVSDDSGAERTVFFVYDTEKCCGEVLTTDMLTGAVVSSRVKTEAGKAFEALLPRLEAVITGQTLAQPRCH